MIGLSLFERTKQGMREITPLKRPTQKNLRFRASKRGRNHRGAVKSNLLEMKRGNVRAMIGEN
jgi:hypothetical protein